MSCGICYNEVKKKYAYCETCKDIYYCKKCYDNLKKYNYFACPFCKGVVGTARPAPFPFPLPFKGAGSLGGPLPAAAHARPVLAAAGALPWCPPSSERVGDQPSDGLGTTMGGAIEPATATSVTGIPVPLTGSLNKSFNCVRSIALMMSALMMSSLPLICCLVVSRRT